MNLLNKAILFNTIIAVFSTSMFGVIKNIDQKKGIWQDQENKHIRFQKFERIDFDFSKVPLKKVKRIILHNKKIFILDSQRSELYVIDQKGNHIRTIGRPGQGPGDLEFAFDMFISSEGIIYVLNALPKRIAVFNSDGESLGTVKLDVPFDLMTPTALLVNSKKDFFIGGSLYHRVSLYTPEGDYVNTLLKGEQKVDYSKPIRFIGCDSKLKFINDDILHFDPFRGVFTRVSQTGNVMNVYSAYFQPANEKVKRLEKSINSQKDQVKGIESAVITLWSDFCIDQKQRIYVAPLSREKKSFSQILFAFSHKGILLYRKNLDYFKKMRIEKLACDKESFIFLTNNMDLIIAYHLTEEK